MNGRERIATMMNLGHKSAERLVAADISDPETLQEIGAAAAYQRVKMRFPKDTSLNLLWAIQGALMEMHWHDLPYEFKQQLRDELASL